MKLSTRKLSLLATLTLTAVSSIFAQEAIRPVAENLVSPELEGTNSVYLRLYAPDAKKVSVIGNITRFNRGNFDPAETTPGQIPMWKYGDIWEVRLDSLVPDLYTYKFNVDGVDVIDPLNVHVVRDVKLVSNQVIVPGGDADYYMTKNDMKRGSLLTTWYTSSFNNADRRLTIYLPAGYADSDRRYPVLYLLHGMGGDETAWAELGRASEILDNLIARGEAEPMIVVMPNGNIARNAAPGHSNLGLEQPDFYLPHTGDGIYENQFPDIVEFVDTHFRTKTDKASRAIAGLSMGGMHSLYTSANYPDMFDYVGLFSAAVSPHNPDAYKIPIYMDRRGKVRNQIEKGVKLYWIGIGEYDFLFDDNKQFRAELDEDGIPYVYVETGGGHEWSNWRHYLIDFARRLFR